MHIALHRGKLMRFLIAVILEFVALAVALALTVGVLVVWLA